MQIVIDIDSYVLEHCKRHVSEHYANNIEEAIANGAPLPEGHGRIVDIGPYEGKVIASRKYCGVNKLIEVAELDTIIEADKGE